MSQCRACLFVCICFDEFYLFSSDGCSNRPQWHKGALTTKHIIDSNINSNPTKSIARPVPSPFCLRSLRNKRQTIVIYSKPIVREPEYLRKKQNLGEGEKDIVISCLIYLHIIHILLQAASSPPII